MGTVRTKGIQQCLWGGCYKTLKDVEKEKPPIEPLRGTWTKCEKEKVGLIPWLPPSK